MSVERFYAQKINAEYQKLLIFLPDKRELWALLNNDVYMITFCGPFEYEEKDYAAIAASYDCLPIPYTEALWATLLEIGMVDSIPWRLSTDDESFIDDVYQTLHSVIPNLSKIITVNIF